MEPIHERIEDFIRRWRSQYEGDRVFRVLVITVVLAAVGVTLSGLQQAPTYEAYAQVWVDQKQGTGNGKIQLIPLAPTPEALRALTQTIIRTIDSRPVAHEVIQRLGLEMSDAELLDKLTVEQVESTSFIVLTYEDTDPYKAKRIVNTVGQVSSELISERSAAGSQLTANVYEEAVAPESPVSTHPLRNGLLTLAIGLVLCDVLTHSLPRSLAAGAAQIADGLVEGSKVRVGQALATVRQGVVRTRLAGGRRAAPREAEAIKEQELLLALGRCGKLTAVGASLETALSVREAERMLQELAAQGHLEVTVEDGKLLYSFWGEDEA